jgi:hypothetical protein
MALRRQLRLDLARKRGGGNGCAHQAASGFQRR